jgi:hypothetical protein
MGLKSQIVKLINAVVPDNSINKTDGIINFGRANVLPNEILNVITDSGTATACISKIKSFIEADGFTQDAENNLKVNPEQTAKQILAEIAYYQALYNGFALKVLYRLDGQIGSIYCLQFDKIRRTVNGGFVYNENFGNSRSFKKADNIYFEAYDRNTAPEERLKIIDADIKKHGTQRGEILYSYILNPYSEFYPYPEYISGLDDIRSDAGLMRLEYRNISRGFRPNVIISTVGEIDDKQVDQTTGKTDAQIFDENLTAFTGEDAATVLHLQAETKDGLPMVTQFPLADLLDGVDKATDRVARKVCRHLQVPPPLIGLTTSEGLGNTQALANSMKLFNHSLVTDQNLIAETFKMLYPVFEWELTTLNIIDYIPAEVLATLTNDEIRAIGGYPALPTTGTTGQVSLAEKLGVGGTQSLVAVLSNPELSAAQKVQTLRILFGLQEEEAMRLTYGQDTIQQPQTPAANVN